MTPISVLWRSRDRGVWSNALARYWDCVQPRNLEIERQLEKPILERVRRMDAQEWYGFLHDEYFRWKYTAPNRYATTTKALRRCEETDRLEELDNVRKKLLSIDPFDVQTSLSVAQSINGLGTAGASGLLSLLYPAYFPTVDQFVVKALREVDDLPEREEIAAMRPEALRPKDAETLVKVLRRKADELNRTLKTTDWTPRKIDKVLWTCGR